MQMEKSKGKRNLTIREIDCVVFDWLHEMSFYSSDSATWK